jgi:hypothetical protein
MFSPAAGCDNGLRPLTHSKAISGLLGRARRRRIVQLLADQLGWALATGLAGLCLLLVTGARLIDLIWPVALLIVAAAVAIGRGRRHIPSQYQVAQVLDERLGLGDVLSTAWHFAGQAPGDFAALLDERAEAAARTADPVAALPWRWSRGATAALAALVVSLGLFTLRYGVLRTLNPRAPLARIAFDTLTGAPQPARDAARQTAMRLPFNEGFSVEDPDGSRVSGEERSAQEALRTVDTPDANQVGRQGTGQDGHPGEKSDEGSEEGESASPGKNPSSGDVNKPGDSNGQPQPRTPPQKENSLLDKMRDALANVMDKLKSSPKGGDSRQTASNKADSKGGQKGERGKQPGQRGQDSQEEGQGTDRTSETEGTQQQARSNQAGSSPESTPNSDKSGIGRADGKKDVELAEQQKALGKLSELLGKRALEVRGEVMVEVTNSKNQQLKTPYLNRTAAHSEAGSDLNRDEVPLHLQDYVQRYYEKVRPAAAATSHAR